MYKDICTRMLTETLLATMKKKKNPRYPSTEISLYKQWHNHIMEYYSAIKKEWDRSICILLNKYLSTHST